MKILARLSAALGFALLAAAAGPALAQYPNKPVRIVVPYPPGGTTDILARLTAARLTESMGQPFVVENRPGASGGIGSQAVAKSAPDGYTLVMATISSHGIVSAISKLPYDPVKDFSPVTVIGSTPNVILVHPDLPAKNLAELLKLAREKSGKLNFGSTSPGGSPHMSAELLKMMAKVDMVHIPYKGAGPMLTDLIGGQIQIGFDNLPSSMGHIKSGKVRAVAVTTTKRWPGTPDVPTVAESGVPGYEFQGGSGCSLRRERRNRSSMRSTALRARCSSSPTCRSRCSSWVPSRAETRQTPSASRSPPKWRNGRRSSRSPA